jgi:hypothetical protein
MTKDLKHTLSVDVKIDKLISFNKKMGFVHLAQGLFMMVFAFFIYPNMTESGPFRIPVFGNYLDFDLNVGSLVLKATGTLFELPFLQMAASFLLISGIFHFLIAFVWKDKYRQGLKLGINQYRWYEYALSSSLMIILIASLFGAYDITVLVLIALANAAMNFFGLDMELLNQGESKVGKKVNWLPFIFGSVVGLAPWIAIAFFILAGYLSSESYQMPGFVWAILATYFIAFNTFPINMYLQYKGIGKFKDYLYGERGYIILSLVAKTLLTWLVLFGAFQP